jgi:hypothetical protein
MFKVWSQIEAELTTDESGRKKELYLTQIHGARPV